MKAARRWLEARRQGSREGFGQSILEDMRFLIRFRSCRSRTTLWRTPSDDERRALADHPIIGRFGDQTLLVADVEADLRAELRAELWIVRDRDWWGWPDPPRYVFFALAEERIRVAADFYKWPAGWTPDPNPGAD